MYQRTFGAWLAVIVAIIWGIVMCLLMQGCAGDSDQKAECEAKAVLAEENPGNCNSAICPRGGCRVLYN
jgi:hypothetical protein